MSNEQQNTREAAIARFVNSTCENEDVARYIFGEGFDAGAASVDRVEIVSKAFADFEVEVNDGRWKSGWRSTEEIKRAMDAVIAAMEEGK